jgi:large subunit ribosomal protein L5
MQPVREKQKKMFDAMKGDFGYTNHLETPRLSKVVVSVGTGSFKDKNKLKIVDSRLAKITGQKAAPRPAKQSIASFKVRQGDPVGYQVTLRGKKMYEFLDKLINVALPRTRDFRGINPDAVDDMGNYTLGIKEHTIFPETGDEELKDVFGMAVTIVTTAKSKEEAKAYLAKLGFPFKKTDDKKEGKK